MSVQVCIDGRPAREARAVLLKGGHLEGAVATDVLVQSSSADVLQFSGPRVQTRNDHGTGCILASAIAANLALGGPLTESVKIARRFVQRCLERSAGLDNGKGRGGMMLSAER